MKKTILFWIQFAVICVFVLVISIFIGQYIGNLYIDKEMFNKNKYALPKQYLPLTAIASLSKKEEKMETKINYKDIVEIRTFTETLPLQVSHPSSSPRQDIEPTPKEEFFKIQVGAFSTRDAADKVKNDLISKGFSVDVLQKQKDDKTFFAVQVVKFKTKEEAEKISDDIKQLGYETFITK